MATYAELLNVANTENAFKQKVMVACVVACDVIRAEDAQTANHDKRMAWARATLENPSEAAARMVWAVLAQNRDLTVTQIRGATDAQVQTAVNAAVNLLAV